MSDKFGGDLILRTVSLPRDVDRILKGATLRLEHSKTDLLRDLIVEAIEARKKKGDPLFVEKTGAPAKPVTIKKSMKGVVGAKAAARKAPKRVVVKKVTAIG